MPLNTFISLVFLLRLLPCHCSFAQFLSPQFTTQGRGFLDLFFEAETGLLRLRADALWDLVARWTGTGAGFTAAVTSSESGASSSAQERNRWDRNLRPLIHKIIFSDCMCVFMIWHLPPGSSMLDLAASKDYKIKHAWIIWDFWCNSEIIYKNKLQWSHAITKKIHFALTWILGLLR